MKRCVITGGGGLIGSHLVPSLQADWEVHAVSRHRPSGRDDKSVVWHCLDVSRDLDRRALPKRADAVIYLAQSEHFREFPERALDIFEVNTVGVLRFLDYARHAGARTFIFASSGGVYGSGNTSMNEDVPVLSERNLGFYLGSKVCSEIVALNYSKLMNIVILRFFFVYGPGQRKTMLIPRLIDAVRRGHPVTLQGPDGIRLNPTYVADATAAVRSALHLDHESVINVAGPQILSLRELACVIGSKVGRTPVFDMRPEDPPGHLVADTEKMRQLLGSPVVDFERGITVTLEAERE